MNKTYIPVILYALLIVGITWLVLSSPAETKTSPKETPVFYLLESPAVFYYVADERGNICRVDRKTYYNFLPLECQSGECKTAYVPLSKTYDFETCRGTK